MYAKMNATNSKFAIDIGVVENDEVAIEHQPT
jgi:hypothetical protein